jgi:integrase
MYGVSLIRSTSRGSRSRSWSMVWVDPKTKKKRKKSTGTADKTLAKEIAHQLHLKLVRKAHGLLDEFEDHLDRPIGQHLKDYEKALTAKKRNDGYAEQTIGRITRLIEECGWETLGDIELTGLELVLGRLTDQRTKKLLAAGGKNSYIASIKAFCGWLVKAKRLATHPLLGLEKFNIAIDRRRVRRPLSPEEFAMLVAVAKASTKTVAGMTGRQRALAYVLASRTGFRRRSLQSLRVCDFDFTSEAVVLPARGAKGNKATPPTPLHPSVVAAVRKAMKGSEPQDHVLPELTKSASSEGIKVDLAAAGIPIADARGYVVDFHALRDTFCQWLKNGGVSLPDCQKLAHHSTPSLTSGTYMTTTTDEARAAVAKLPPPPSLD